MKFLAVSRAAAEALAADRFLQACEFLQGLQFAEFLQDPAAAPPDLPRVHVHRGSEGVAMVGRQSESADTLVFDLEQSGLLGALPADEALLVFQKVLRFALRYWANQKFPASEKPIKGTSRVVVFPFPISTQSSFRVVIETAPDNKRLAKRPHLGRCLLVFASGTDDKCGAAAQAEVATFRKALEATAEARREAREVTATDVSTGDGITAVGLTRLSSLPGLIDGHIGFEAWERNLTAAQREFVTSPLVGPHRIEGPAGTGKTICLVLRAIAAARTARAVHREARLLFLAHSEATRRTIQTLFDANDGDQFSQADAYSSQQSIRVATLQELCGELLGREISETEYLDRDALESKNTQLLYIDEALTESLDRDLQTHRPFLSKEFLAFLDGEDRWKLALMLQHEISVVIKGRAQENIDNYKVMTRTNTGLPLSGESDRGFVFVIYQRYQEKLRAAAAFDTDDVVLSAFAQLNTPIWRRRRAREGYDGLFVDETHLFNLNELSVLHHLTRSDAVFPIAYAADPSQALEDRGWSDQVFDDALGQRATTTTKIKAVFRCSPDITNLALSVTAAGATLFANFDNPLRGVTSAFTAVEERQSAPPLFLQYANDEEMIAGAFQRAEAMTQVMQAGRSSVAIVVFDEALFGATRRFAAEANKPVELLTRRGDVEVVHRASRSGRFVLSTPDYVGGLEFSGVVLVGVDRGRVPPTDAISSTGSAAFLAYQAHSRLYVALTRARFRVEVLGNVQRRPSDVLRAAVESGSIEVQEASSQ